VVKRLGSRRLLNKSGEGGRRGAGRLLVGWTPGDAEANKVVSHEFACCQKLGQADC